jgi:ribose 5-phosphate isomerase RpiB
MIVTARQLEDLHRSNGSNGQLTLPYRARLSPLAADWIRARKIVIGYSDVAGVSNGNSSTGDSSPAKAQAAEAASSEPTAMLWWCDGPCGAAKAAVVAHEKESKLKPLDKPADAKQLVAVIKMIAAEVKAGRSQGAVLLVQNGALATVYANRCPSLRAILGTSLDVVEQGVRAAAANVLIIEYPQKTLQQVKNLLGRFTRGKRTVSEEMQKQLQELASCG